METGSVLSLALGPGPPGLDTSLRVTRGNLEVKEAAGRLCSQASRAQTTETEASQGPGQVLLSGEQGPEAWVQFR